MTLPRITPAILCGGSGTRLWPLSRKSLHKQFVSLVGDNRLLRPTVERFAKIKPGASFSLQMHCHPAEHWIVVSSTAEVTNGETMQILTENQSTYVSLGQTHRLANPGKVPHEIIEVQSGSYLGEEDIVRLEDAYGRQNINYRV